MLRGVNKIACAISGGVDSCVAALVLKKLGYNVHGVFMRNWDIADEKGYCQADHDMADARYICNKLEIPFSEVNFVKEYWNNVFRAFIQEYKNGITPNPDILCNKKIKFDLFLKYAIEHLQVDAVATGHYARVYRKSNGDVKLFKGLDPQKDQTFFLGQISKAALQKCIFPVGNLIKSKVKEIATAAGFEKIVKKRESVGICFIGKRNFQNFILDYIEPEEGNFINVENGQIIGTHKGVHCWTVGQRCRIPGQPSAFYVAERDAVTQNILVAPGRMHPALFHQTLITETPHWINGPPVNLDKGEHFVCDFRFQHREPLVKCFLYKDSENRLEIFLKTPLRALTPGQFAVFYSEAECLGSAKILLRGPSLYHQKSIEEKLKEL